MPGLKSCIQYLEIPLDNGYIQQLMKESDYDVNNQVAYYEHLYEKKSN